MDASTYLPPPEWIVERIRARQDEIAALRQLLRVARRAAETAEADRHPPARGPAGRGVRDAS